jgi:hypothetical protein
MAPKGKSAPASGPAKLKPATSINVRHILCEKHSKKEEALARLKQEHKFDDVAKDMSEDKARQGMWFLFYFERGVVEGLEGDFLWDGCGFEGEGLFGEGAEAGFVCEGLSGCICACDCFDAFPSVVIRSLIRFDCVGGSLGWKPRGQLLPEFEKVAYELEPSTTAKPKWGEVKTTEGYHIIMVEGRK